MTDISFFIAWTSAGLKNIVDDVDAERMMEAKTAKEARRVLQDSDYASHLSSDPNDNIESIFRKNREQLKDNLQRMGLDEKVTRFLFLDDDILLLRAILQKEIFGISFPEEMERVLDDSGVAKVKNLFFEEAKELLRKKPKTPADLSNDLTNLYWSKAESYANYFGEEILNRFLAEYKKDWRLARDGDADALKSLRKKEKDFVNEAGRRSEGVAPLFSFVLKKRRAENLTRMILGAKEMDIDSGEIHKKANNVRAMM